MRKFLLLATDAASAIVGGVKEAMRTGKPMTLRPVPVAVMFEATRIVAQFVGPRMLSGVGGAR